MSSIFCDYLDVTYAPDDVPFPDLRLIMLDTGFTCEFDNTRSLLFRVPRSLGYGTVKVLFSGRFGKISLSGDTCAAFRSMGLWAEVLTVLASSPHKVTRLDAAFDVARDFPSVLSALQSRYPSGNVALGRKGLPVVTMLETRPDGEQGGTYYVGHRTAARATARVYDKRLEVFKKRGAAWTDDPLTRFEITARKDYGATLHDAYSPAALFWHIASPALLKRPEDAPVWKSHSDYTGWQTELTERTPFEVMRNRVEWSAEIEALADVADSIGDDGRALLARELLRKIGVEHLLDGLRAS